MLYRLEMPDGASFATSNAALGVPDEKAFAMRDGRANQQAAFCFESMKGLAQRLFNLEPMGHA